MRRFTFFFLAVLSTTVYAQTPIEKVISDENQMNNAFGDAVSVSGGYLVVGAFLDDNVRGEKAGAAYVFRQDGGNFIQEARLLVSGSDAEDRSGEVVAVRDGRAVVTNRGEDGGGAIYVFRNDPTGWIEEARLTAPDLETDEVIGADVRYEDPYLYVSGVTVRVFKRDGTAWTYLNQVKTPADHEVGPAAANADWLVGSRSFLNVGQTASVFAVHVFKREGDTWTQQRVWDGAASGSTEWRQLRAAIGDEFLAIAAHDPNDGHHSIHVFHRTADTWSYHSTVTADDAATAGFFVSEIKMTDELIVAGDPTQSPNGPQSGAAYVFRRFGDEWRQQTKLIPADGVAEDRYGAAVAVDTSYVVIGQDGHQVGTTGPSGFGAAYVYTVEDLRLVAVAPTPVSARDLVISGPFPNPARAHWRFLISAKGGAHISVELYDLLGRRIEAQARPMVDRQGPFEVVVPATDLSSGVYVLKVRVGDRVETRAVVRH